MYRQVRGYKTIAHPVVERLSAHGRVLPRLGGPKWHASSSGKVHESPVVVDARERPPMIPLSAHMASSWCSYSSAIYGRFTHPICRFSVRRQLRGDSPGRTSIDSNWSPSSRSELQGIHTEACKRCGVVLNRRAREVLLAQARFRAKHCPDSELVSAPRQASRTAACSRVSRQPVGGPRLRSSTFTTCAAWLIQARVSITQVRDVFGHSTVAMTEKYAHLAPANSRAAVALLEGDSSRLRHGGNREEKAVG
jgi:hypothetical protein